MADELLPAKGVSGVRVNPEAKAILSKLPAAEVIAIFEGLPVAADINVNNNSVAAELSREDLMKAVEKVPANVLRDVLKGQGLIR